MPDSFGARLRRQREERGIALGAIAKQTRIKESLLEALERDDLSQWPTGFYRRAFFRAYASAIQLDPDAAFREFQALHPEPPAMDVMAAMAAALGRAEGNGRSTALRGAVGSALNTLSRFRRSTGIESAPPSEAAQPDTAIQVELPTPLQRDYADADGREVPSPAAEPASVPLRATAPDASLAPPVAPSQEPLSAPTAETAGQQPLAAPAPPRASDNAPDLFALAHLCTEFGCVTSALETQPLLEEAARLLDAAGLIVWAWNPGAAQLQPALFHGYSPRVLAQLPMVRRDDDNATAVSFRTAQTRVINDTASGECAFVVPLRTASGCVGAFAVELERGREATKARIAVATVLAAQLAPIADCMAQPEQIPLPHAVNGVVQTV